MNPMSDQDLTASIDRLDRTVDRLDGTLDTLDGTLDRLDATIDRVNRTLDDNHLFMKDLARHLDTAMKRSDALNEHMIGRFEALTDAIRLLIDRTNGGPAAA
jgi:ABC-type transporter Mla subunit MlaD